MSVHAVMRAWRISREQPLPHEQELPAFAEPAFAEPAFAEPAFSERAVVAETRPSPVWKRPETGPVAGGSVLEQEPAAAGGKPDGIVPRRRGGGGIAREDDSLWASDLFWKGIVIGVLAAVVVKLILEIQAPFGVGWYGY